MLICYLWAVHPTQCVVNIGGQGRGRSFLSSTKESLKARTTESYFKQVGSLFIANGDMQVSESLLQMCDLILFCVQSLQISSLSLPPNTEFNAHFLIKISLLLMWLNTSVISLTTYAIGHKCILIPLFFLYNFSHTFRSLIHPGLFKHG